jgi:hypothetical protein
VARQKNRIKKKKVCYGYGDNSYVFVATIKKKEKQQTEKKSLLRKCNTTIITTAKEKRSEMPTKTVGLIS